MSFELVPMGPAHAGLAAAIHRQCFRRPWDATAMAELLAMPGCFGLIAGCGTPVGLILCRLAADEAEIVTVCVMPAARGRGHAGRLLDAALQRARAAGAAHCFLEVAADNAEARRLYQRRGFVEVGRRRDYYGPGGHALVLRRAC